MVLERLLTPLQEIDGYRASAIFNLQGKVIAKSNHSAYSVDALGQAMANLTENCTQSLLAVNLGNADFIQVDTEDGILLEMWVWHNEAILVALFDNGASIGLIKTRMRNIVNTGFKALLPKPD